MAGEEIGGAQLRCRVGIDAAGAHEADSLGDAVRDFLVALVGGRILEEVERPLVDVLEVGITALRKGAQQVERGGRLAVGHDLALRIGAARFHRLFGAVDDIATVDRQLDAADGLGGRGARLGELTGDAADLHHRLAAGEGQDHGHLQEDAEEVADIVGRMLGEALGAVAALKQETLALRNARQLALQLARLTGEDQRRITGKLLLDRGQLGLILVVRHLHDREVPPAVRCPVRRHYRYSKGGQPPYLW